MKPEDLPWENPWTASPEWDQTTQWRWSTGGVAEPVPFEDVVRVVCSAERSHDGWDGEMAAIVELNDGCFVCWESGWGPTGSGFHPDAYGGDAVAYLATDLETALYTCLGEESRLMLGYPARRESFQS